MRLHLSLGLVALVSLPGIFLACGSPKSDGVVAPANIASIASSSSAAPPISSAPSAASSTPQIASAPNDAGAASEPAYPSSTCESDVTRMRTKFRRCYQTGLANDPNMQGREIVLAKVQEDGSVSSAKVESNSGLSNAVAECIRAVVELGPLHCGSGVARDVRIPVNFVPAPSASASAAAKPGAP